MTIYSHTHPFMASIEQRIPLCTKASGKETKHLVINLEKSDIQYEEGDCLAIFPSNPKELIEKTLYSIQCQGHEKVHPRLKSLKKNSFSLFSYLESKVDLCRINVRLVKAVLSKQKHPKKAQHLQNLIDDPSLFALFQKEHLVWEFIEEHKEVFLSPQEWVDCFFPMAPRLYSIASSMQKEGPKAHLIVSKVTYEINHKKRMGICSHFLCDLAPLHTPCIPLYLHRNRRFTLPDNPKTPIIMIATGTGIAPFRAFMQKRESQTEANKNYLFFGERHAKHHFYYKDFWQRLLQEKKLSFDVAFSRDQKDKIYVQHKLWEKRKTIFTWIEEGGYLFICGDAKKMAKDVETMLLTIIQKEGNLSVNDSEEYLQILKKQKRYLKDVY